MRITFAIVITASLIIAFGQPAPSEERISERSGLAVVQLADGTIELKPGSDLKDEETVVITGQRFLLTHVDPNKDKTGLRIVGDVRMTAGDTTVEATHLTIGLGSGDVSVTILDHSDDLVFRKGKDVGFLSEESAKRYVEKTNADRKADPKD